MSLAVVSTIKFNVGGRMFEVNRSLLQHFPETLLAKLSQEQDGDDDSNNSCSSNEKKAYSHSDDNEILFIDRDSERFACILNYMRDGEVDLPMNISKQSLLKDFAYYGFDSIDPDSIGTCLSLSETLSILKHYRVNFSTTSNQIIYKQETLEIKTRNNIKQIREEAIRKVEELNAEKESIFRQLEVERCYNYIAYECFREYCKNFDKEVKILLRNMFKLDSTELETESFRDISINTKIQECFASYGLEAISITTAFPEKVFVKFDVTNKATNIRAGKRCRE